MYVITGATGNTGNRIAHTLLDAARPVRAIGRDAGRLDDLRSRGAEIAVGDLADADFLADAFRGADAVYALIPPNFAAPDFRGYQRQVGAALTEGVRRADVTRVATLSSVGAHRSSGAGVVAGLHDLEGMLDALSGVHVLHLRPTYFMENLLGQIGTIRGMGVVGSPLAADLRYPMIATRDIADVAARRLLALDWEGAGNVQYLLGPRDVSNTETAAIVGASIGRPDLPYVQLPNDAFRQAMSGAVSPSLIEAYVEFLDSMNAGRITEDARRTPDTTTPTTLEQWAADEFAPAFAGGGM